MATQSLTDLSPIFSRPTSPYTTAPSSPKLLGYFSDDDSDFELLDSVCSFVPFDWEEKPGKPKTSHAGDDDYADDIAFEFRVDRLQKNLSLPAEDLFDGGIIKPLKPPPRLQIESVGIADSAAPISGRKSVSPRSGQMIVNFVDPFEAAIESARNGDRLCCEIETSETASFLGPSRYKRLRNFLLFRRFSDGSSSRASNNAGFGSTGRSGSGSSSTSGSVNEPDIGYEVGRRSLPLCRPHFFRCFMESI